MNAGASNHSLITVWKLLDKFGVEYEVAVNLIYSGCVEEGLTVVKSIRDRYDGYTRNPFSEIESGHHYCRAMASWGVLNALLGLQSDMYRGTL